jgi:hypothetical protein
MVRLIERHKKVWDGAFINLRVKSSADDEKIKERIARAAPFALIENHSKYDVWVVKMKNGSGNKWMQALNGIVGYNIAETMRKASGTGNMMMYPSGSQQKQQMYVGQNGNNNNNFSPCTMIMNNIQEMSAGNCGTAPNSGSPSGYNEFYHHHNSSSPTNHSNNNNGTMPPGLCSNNNEKSGTQPNGAYDFYYSNFGFGPNANTIQQMKSKTYLGTVNTTTSNGILPSPQQFQQKENYQMNLNRQGSHNADESINFLIDSSASNPLPPQQCYQSEEKFGGQLKNCKKNLNHWDGSVQQQQQSYPHPHP